MSAVIGCGIAAAVFAFIWNNSANPTARAFVWVLSMGFAIAAAVAGFLA